MKNEVEGRVGLVSKMDRTYLLVSFCQDSQREKRGEEPRREREREPKEREKSVCRILWIIMNNLFNFQVR